VPRSIDVYLEIGKRRTFAGAIDHPGWCRSGRDPDAALEALGAYAPRYARAVKRPAKELDASPNVVERLKGDASTEFGVPGTPPKADARNLAGDELKRQLKILESCWAAFDAAARKAKGRKLSTGPRGGGRTLDAIVRHVFEADGAYLRALASPFRPGDAPTSKDTANLRKELLATLTARARGEEAPPSPRRKKPPWSPRYAIRRSAWHALDHAWEIEDRAQTKQKKKAPG